MKLKITGLLLGMLLCLSVRGQDIHYTQFDWIPMLFHPAKSGNIINANMQYGAIYRDQAFTVTPQSYKSFAAFADAKIEKGFREQDFMGLSLMVLNDQAGTGSLTTNQALLNWAYHLRGNDKNVFSLGVQGAYMHRSFGDLAAFKFEEELNGSVFSENLQSDNRQYIDINAGLAWTSRVDENSDLHLGFGVYHFNHKSTLADLTLIDKFKLRYTTSVEYQRQLSARLALSPKLQYQLSEKAQELLVQAMLSYLISEYYNAPVKLKAGLGWRKEDALQLLLGLDLNGWEVGLAYDYPISGLAKASGWVGGLELGIKYRHNRPEKKEPKPLPPIPEPKPILINLSLSVEGALDSVELLVLQEIDTLNNEILENYPFERPLEADRNYQLIVERNGYIGDTIVFNTQGIIRDSLIEQLAILRRLPPPIPKKIIEEKIPEPEPELEPETLPEPEPEPEVKPEPETTGTPKAGESKERILYRDEPLVLEKIFYNYNSARILPDAEPDLTFLLKLLRQYPDMVIELSSHCDARGDDEYNRLLSQKRASSAKKWLLRRGIATSRIIAKGYGEQNILNRCTNGVNCIDEEHRFNRRTEFKIIAGPTSIRYKVEE